MIKIQDLKKRYFNKYIEVPYSLRDKSTIKIKPLTVNEWEDLEELGILQFDKISTGNIDIIQMSYLKFLICIYCVEVEGAKEIFETMLSIVFQTSVDNIKFFEESATQKIIICISNDKGEMLHKINEHDFEEIRQIILYQNIEDYDDDIISPDVKELIYDYVSMMSKNRKHPTLQEKKVYFFTKKNIDIYEIGNMNYRLFMQSYDMIHNCEEYLVRKIMQASEKWKIDGEVEHPLFAQKQSIYEQVLGQKTTVVNKVNQANGVG